MYHIIVNPSSKSGLGLKCWKQLKKLLLSEMITYNVQFTSGSMSAYKCVRQLTSRNFKKPLKLIVLGGDGTVNEVLNGIQSFDDTILTYLPTGSSNDLARDMNRTSEPAELIERLQTVKAPASMDFGVTKYKGGRRRFTVSSGIGFDAAVCEQALHSPVKNILNALHLGRLTYGFTAVNLLLHSRQVSCDVYVDGSPTPIHLDRMLFLAAMNHKYEGGGFMFAPDADASDGLLDVCLVGNIRLWRVPYLLPLAMKGKHIGHKGIYSFRAKELEIKVSSPLPVHTDGEICGYYDRLHIACEKNMLKYI